MKSDNEKKRMVLIVKRFQKYVATYSDQLLYTSYSDETFLNDMLYGIGLAFNPKVFKFSKGYEDWRVILHSFLGTGKFKLKKPVSRKKVSNGTRG